MQPIVAFEAERELNAMIAGRQGERMNWHGEHLSGCVTSTGFGGATMTIGYKLGSSGPEPIAGDEGASFDRSGEAQSSRQVDERTAVYLLSLARELLRRDHGAIAGMIDYAIAEIEGGPEQ